MVTAGGEGSTFGKYFLLKKIASGGMGEIFLAKLRGPVGFEKLLVIKRILAQHVENDEFVDMFFAEARIAAQLSHANIVQIYEMGEVDEAYFIAMEYVHGKSLRDVIDRARQRGEYIPPAHAIEILGWRSIKALLALLRRDARHNQGAYRRGQPGRRTGRESAECLEELSWGLRCRASDV